MAHCQKVRYHKSTPTRKERSKACSQEVQTTKITAGCTIAGRATPQDNGEIAVAGRAAPQATGKKSRVGFCLWIGLAIGQDPETGRKADQAVKPIPTKPTHKVDTHEADAHKADAHETK